MLAFQLQCRGRRQGLEVAQKCLQRRDQGMVNPFDLLLDLRNKAMLCRTLRVLRRYWSFLRRWKLSMPDHLERSAVSDAIRGYWAIHKGIFNGRSSLTYL